MRLNSDCPSKGAAGLIILLSKLRLHGDSGFDPFADLLQITFASAATLKPGIDVRKKGSMCGDIFIRQHDQPHITNDIDIGFSRIQGEQFGALVSTIGSRIDTG